MVAHLRSTEAVKYNIVALGKDTRCVEETGRHTHFFDAFFAITLDALKAQGSQFLGRAG